MKSPFPGMDPYLEKHWRDVHARLILYACDQMEEQLPGNLIARVEERVVEPGDAPGRNIYPDVRVMEQGGGRETGGVAVSDEIAIAEPIIVDFGSEKITETFIRVSEPGNRNKLVTVIEILSFSNKLPGESQSQYLQKQKELLQSPVNLVEIDLLRAGNRVLSLPNPHIPRTARTTYQACVHRGAQPGRFEVYRLPLSERLPAIAIPLRKKDPDIRLDLQALVDQAYRKGRYHRTLDYSQPAEPAFEGAERKWVETLLKAKKR